MRSWRVGPGALSRAHFTQRARRLRFIVVATADPAAPTSTHTMSASTSFASAATVSGARHLASSKSVRGVAIRAPARVAAPTSRGATLRVNAEGTSPTPPSISPACAAPRVPVPRGPLSLAPLVFVTSPASSTDDLANVARRGAALVRRGDRDARAGRAAPRPRVRPPATPRTPSERARGPSPRPRLFLPPHPAGWTRRYFPPAQGEARRRAVYFPSPPPRARVPRSLTLPIPPPDSNSVREEPRGDA